MRGLLRVAAVLSYLLLADAIIKNDDDELRLVHDLFANSSQEVRPVKNKESAIKVFFGIAYTQLVELDAKNQVLVSNVWIRQRWNNHLLRWNESHYGGIKSINIDPKLVWLPDIVLYNNAEKGLTSGSMDQFKTKVILSSDGTNTWYAPSILRSRCSIDITFFPFDDQRCTLHFGSWTYDGLRVDLTNMSASVDLSSYMPSGEFEMINAPVDRIIVRYSCCPEPYPNLVFTLHIRRKVLFYFNNLIVPCFLITAFALLTFVLPPNTGERVTLVITTLLAMTVFMLMIAENTPTTSDVTPLIGKFFVASMVEIGLALIATCFVLNIYESTGPSEDVPNWIRTLLLEYLAPLLRVTKPKEKPTHKISSNPHYTHGYVPIFPDSNGNPPDDHTNNSTPKDVIVMTPKVGDKMLNSRDFITTVNDNHMRFRGGNPVHDRLLEGITILTDRAREQEKVEGIKEEWESVARVIDRLFLLLFIATVAISTAMIFLQRPSYATM
ncbi:neuronal acetylcholine receptor subunit alpha-10 isoform X2 [Nematostella vectensis]|uniref:neuronal acetylcholine receptor subunit alpha-10 isoform X2 n=1 Tax=Nematostella vectensis TaxID=45351 RepID=UPI00207778D6|nr:neuronal acetylcholine receptor subunit alpha-10 isoform X2 [Nematostella vectensis]XP_048578438.1 neuronal acetylcholine receptor subunit alpha-10 isoform X2 [Nematostella vectensis]XP_048578439.1 neuronal acetylcholine receptor subunit alpha-10 isoform X2 [Nematostella vectensis]XP_048578440.1 neuronal acetylcholine receptor subunit alpha-10 isoform X2 [Nematostella vectensis]